MRRRPPCRGSWALLAVLLAWPGAARAVELGPRLRAEAARLAGAPPLTVTAPVAPWRLVAEGPELDAFLGRLAAAGIRAETRLGVGRVDLAPDRLPALAGDEDVRIDLPRPLRPSLDVSLPALGMTSALRGERDGRDVLVAVLDTGIDFEHPDFRHDDGSTRFVFYWDQTADGSEESIYGIVCDTLDIDEGRCPNRSEEPYPGFLPAGHGSHVAGIAAGGDARFRGVAPGALLIGVRLNFDEAGVIDGLEVVRQVAEALDRPVVVNLSLGSAEGAHDGSSPSERAIDAFVRPGRLVVAAAGNEGPGSLAGRMHAAFPLDGTPRRARYRALPLFAGETLVAELWADAEAAPTVRVLLEGASTAGEWRQIGETATVDLAAVAAGGVTVPVRSGNVVWADLEVVPQTAASGARGARLRLRGVADRMPADGRWQLEVGGEGGIADVWLPERNARFETTAGPQVVRFADDTTAVVEFVAGDAERTITLPGTARGAITVTGWVSRGSWTDASGAARPADAATALTVDTLLPMASFGPTRDGRAKPDLAAPGGWISSTRAEAWAVGSTLRIDEDHFLTLGTSMASPHVAGVVALLLEGRPDADPDEARAALQAASVGEFPTGTTLDPTRWGAGRLDLAALAATDLWPPIASDGRGPAMTDGRLRLYGDGWAVEAATDELARLEVLDPAGRVLASRASHGLRHRLSGSGAPERVRLRMTDPRGNAALGPWLTGEDGGCGCHVGPGGGDGALPTALLAVVAGMIYSGYIARRRKAADHGP